MKQIVLDPSSARWGDLEQWLQKELDDCHCSPRDSYAVLLSAEEVFANIANYAFPNIKGLARVTFTCGDDRMLTLTFEDDGIPYNPLKKADPDLTLSAEDRRIGGLGIFLIKKMMDEVIYDNSNGTNQLILRKKI